MKWYWNKFYIKSFNNNQIEKNTKKIIWVQVGTNLLCNFIYVLTMI